MNAVVHLSTTVVFPAEHRLHNPALSEAENRRIFGKCNHPAGHGHQYSVTVTLRGPLDQRTGQIEHHERFAAQVFEALKDLMHYRRIDSTFAPFARGGTFISSGENITAAIWEVLEPRFPGRLHRVAVEETPRNSFEYGRT